VSEPERGKEGGQSKTDLGAPVIVIVSEASTEVDAVLSGGSVTGKSKGGGGSAAASLAAAGVRPWRR
jgi:hypothetical protein